MPDNTVAIRCSLSRQAEAGRLVQEAAMSDPEYADDDTAELMAMLEEERERRAA